MVLSNSPRVLIASFTAYFFGSLLNAYVMVYLKEKAEKYLFIMSVTMIPSSVGYRRFFSRETYPLEIIVDIVGAYVDGLPIPFSSSVRTRLASV